MGLSIRFPKFIKNAFSHKQEENPSSSRTVSIASSGYTRDPVRCGNHPDVVGHYYDPMGGRFTLTRGFDVTNTGA